MLVIRRILQLRFSGLSLRDVAISCDISRTTLGIYLTRIAACDRTASELLALDDELLSACLQPIPSELSAAADPRYAEFISLMPYFLKELSKPKVTRMVLWEEYIRDHPSGYRKSQFFELLGRELKVKNATMRLNHVPGDALYFDFAGDYLSYADTQTGELIRCPVFVAVLPFSSLMYVEALVNQQREHMLKALNNALQFFGGVTKSLLSDNMRQLVKKADRYEPSFDELSLQLSVHYNTTLMATRVKAPKDKASVESSVNTAYRRIYPFLRHNRATCLDSLNKHIMDGLVKLNDRPMQNRDYSRLQRFQDLEKHTLIPLPGSPFVPKSTVSAKVDRSYHVMLGQDKHYYSVPYTHIAKQVKIIYDTDHVEIYLGQDRIASHRRNFRKWEHTTLKEHMPENHVQHLISMGWNDKYFIEQARKIGPFTEQVICSILSRTMFTQQNYKSCLGTLKLASKYSEKRLEAACKRMHDSPKIGYGSIKSVLEKNLDKTEQQTLTFTLPLHENIRGQNPPN